MTQRAGDASGAFTGINSDDELMGQTSRDEGDDTHDEKLGVVPKDHQTVMQENHNPADEEIVSAEFPRQPTSTFPRRLRQQNLELVHKMMVYKRKKMEGKRSREIYREALLNTRNTITLVAILISTFTYNAGLSPPGGVHQDGTLIGTSVSARTTAFRVFSVCNNLALFTSLSVVLVLVSIIPFKRKALMRMLAVAHKAIWAAVSFMSIAYVAAGVVIMQPQQRQWKSLDWTAVFLVCICGGCLGSVFVSLGIMLVKHRVMKRKWRQGKASRTRASTEMFYSSSGSSTISDMAVTPPDHGYTSY